MYPPLPPAPPVRLDRGPVADVRPGGVVGRAVVAGSGLGMLTGTTVGTCLFPVIGSFIGLFIGTAVGLALGLVCAVPLVAVQRRGGGRAGARAAGGLTSAGCALGLSLLLEHHPGMFAAVVELVFVALCGGLGAAVGPRVAFGRRESG